MQDWERVNTLYQSEDSNLTQPSQRVKKKKVERLKGEQIMQTKKALAMKQLSSRYNRKRSLRA